MKKVSNEELMKAEFLTNVCFEALEKATEEEAKVLKGKIVEMTIPLVVSIVNKFNRGYLDSLGIYEDVVNEGILGLYDAIEHYDTSKKQAKFTSFCYLYIKGSVCAYIDNNKELANYPSKFFQDVNNVNKWLQSKHVFEHEHIYNNYEKLYEKAMAEVTLCKATGGKNLRAMRIERALKYALSLSYRSIEDDLLYTAKDITGYTAKELFSETDMENRVVLKDIYSKLSEEEKKVLCLLYQEYKKQEIVRMLGLTIAKVNKIIENIKVKAIYS